MVCLGSKFFKVGITFGSRPFGLIIYFGLCYLVATRLATYVPISTIVCYDVTRVFGRQTSKGRGDNCRYGEGCCTRGNYCHSTGVYFRVDNYRFLGCIRGLASSLAVLPSSVTVALSTRETVHSSYIVVVAI